MPYIEVSHEQKTKPTQHSVKELQNLGIQPDVIICRSDYEIDASSKGKMSLFCNVEKDCILQSLTTDNIYEIPLRLEEQGLAGAVLRKLKLEDRQPDLSAQIAFYEKNLSRLSDFDGVIVPAGFGVRGFDGKVAAAKYVRENGIPALMIGLGAQAALVEFARDVLGKAQASSTEFAPDTPDPIVYSPNKQPTFRKGLQVCKLVRGSKLEKIYSSGTIKERHRHKYEFNAAYASELAEHGLKFSGFSPDGIPEAFESDSDVFFIGTIFRPEFISRPNRPHPLITAFLKACKKA